MQREELHEKGVKEREREELYRGMEEGGRRTVAAENGEVDWIERGKKTS